MFNREVPHKTSADVLAANSQIASYFNAVDNAVSIGDTNKRYQPVNNTSYGPPPFIHPNTFTTVIISPTADNTADIYNGYISAEMKVKVSIDKTIPAWSDKDKHTYSTTNDGGETVNTDVEVDRELKNPYFLWVGFKDSMDAIEKYEIMANGISIYTQNNAIEESYITGCAMPEAAKRGNNFSHVRHKDIFNGKLPYSCGEYVNFANVSANNTVEITIPLKIDLRRFLPLSNIKYLPAFAGKIELRILFGIQGLVMTPISPISCFTTTHGVSKFVIDEITNEFVPVSEPITMITKYTKPTYQTTGANMTNQQPAKIFGKLEAEEVKAHAVMNYVSKCESVIYCFGIASDVYDALVARYVETPLTFPTQTLSFAPLAAPLKGNETGTTSITLTPRFVDSLFLLFPMKQTCRTCHKNPQLEKFSLQCGGYGCIPGASHGTKGSDSAMTLEELQNALNVNCDTVCLNKDVVRSLISTESDFTIGHESMDSTNFLLGFATETDNTFQQGQTSNTPITYTFQCKQNKDSYYCQNVEVPPVVGVLVDSTFSIQIRPDGAPPIVEIGAYDITSPIMMG